MSLSPQSFCASTPKTEVEEKVKQTCLSFLYNSFTKENTNLPSKKDLQNNERVKGIFRKQVLWRFSAGAVFFFIAFVGLSLLGSLFFEQGNLFFLIVLGIVIIGGVIFDQTIVRYVIKKIFFIKYAKEEKEKTKIKNFLKTVDNDFQGDFLKRFKEDKDFPNKEELLRATMWLAIDNHNENNNLECGKDCLLHWLFLRGVVKRSKKKSVKLYKIWDILRFMKSRKFVQHNAHRVVVTDNYFFEFFNAFNPEAPEELSEVSSPKIWKDQLLFLREKLIETGYVEIVMDNGTIHKITSTQQIDIQNGLIFFNKGEASAETLTFHHFHRKKVRYKKKYIMRSFPVIRNKEQWKVFLKTLKAHIDKSGMLILSRETLTHEGWTATNVFKIDEETESIVMVDPHYKDNVLRSYSFSDLVGRNVRYFPFPVLEDDEMIPKFQKAFQEIDKQATKKIPWKEIPYEKELLNELHNVYKQYGYKNLPKDPQSDDFTNTLKRNRSFWKTLVQKLIFSEEKNLSKDEESMKEKFINFLYSFGRFSPELKLEVFPNIFRHKLEFFGRSFMDHAHSELRPVDIGMISDKENWRKQLRFLKEELLLYKKNMWRARAQGGLNLHFGEEGSVYSISYIDLGREVIVVDANTPQQKEFSFNDFENKNLFIKGQYFFRTETCEHNEKSWKEFLENFEFRMGEKCKDQILLNIEMAPGQIKSYTVLNVDSQNASITLQDLSSTKIITKTFFLKDFQGKKFSYMFHYPSHRAILNGIMHRVLRNPENPSLSDLFDRIYEEYFQKGWVKDVDYKNQQLFYEKVLEKLFFSNIISELPLSDNEKKLKKYLMARFLKNVKKSELQSEMKNLFLERFKKYRLMLKMYDWHILNKNVPVVSEKDTFVEPQKNFEMVLKMYPSLKKLKKKFSLKKIPVAFVPNLETPAQYVDGEIQLNESFWNHTLSHSEILFNVSILIHEFLRVKEGKKLKNFVHFFNRKQSQALLKKETDLLKKELEIIYKTLGPDDFEKLIETFTHYYDVSQILQRTTDSGKRLEWDTILKTFLSQKIMNSVESKAGNLDSLITNYLDISVNA